MDVITIPTIIGAAVIDSINPCAIGVLIFLLSYLLALKSKKLILKIGLTYIITVYVVYFLAGLGLLSFIASTNMTTFVYYLSGALLIILGLINLKDFFLPGKGISLKIPESKKAIIEKWAKKASLPGAIVLGFLVSAFELPCTGGIYFAILAILGKMGMTWQPVFYLLLYNLFFVLPLVIITGIVYYGSSSENVSKWFKKDKKWLRLAMGIGMVGLGGLIVFGVI